MPSYPTVQARWLRKALFGAPVILMFVLAFFAPSFERDVSAGGTITPVPGAPISGRVVNLAGAPVSGALIEGRPCSYDIFTFGPCPVDTTTTTGSDGRFTLPITGSSRVLEASASGYGKVVFKDTIWLLRGSAVQGGTNVGDIVLHPAKTGNIVLNGVVASNGAPVPDAQIIVKRASCAGAENAGMCQWISILPFGEHYTANAAGQFSITIPEEDDEILSNEYRLAVTDPASEFAHLYVDFHGGQPFLMFAGNTYTHNPQMNPAGAITGKVRDGSGVPVEGATVLGMCFGCPPSQPAVTGTDGSYRLKGLGAGTWNVRVPASPRYLEAYYTKDDSLGLVPIGVGVTKTDIDIVVTLAGGISGRVLSKAGVPLEGIRVSSQCVQPVTGCSSGSARTGADGTYSMRPLVPHTWTIQFSDDSGVFKPVHYTNAQNADGATPVVITAGDSKTLDDVTLDNYRVILGRITDQAGNPLPNILVSASIDGCVVDDQGPCSVTGATDSSGRYLLSRLTRSGPYVVSTYDYADIHKQMYYDGALAPESGTPITLSEGQIRRSVNFVLPRVDGTIPEPLGHLVSPGSASSFEPSSSPAQAISIPAGAVAETTRLTSNHVADFRLSAATAEIDAAEVDAPENQYTGVRFSIDATQSSSIVDAITFLTPLTVTVAYETYNVNSLDETKVTVLSFDEATWQWKPNGITVLSRDADANRIVITTDHGGVFGLFANLPSDDIDEESGTTVFLPAVQSRK